MTQDVQVAKPESPLMATHRQLGAVFTDFAGGPCTGPCCR